MASTLDGNCQLALLPRTQAGLADLLDLAVYVDVTLQSFDIFVVKIYGRVFFESFGCHKINFSFRRTANIRMEFHLNLSVCRRYLR